MTADTAGRILGGDTAGIGAVADVRGIGGVGADAAAISDGYHHSGIMAVLHRGLIRMTDNTASSNGVICEQVAVLQPDIPDFCCVDTPKQTGIQIISTVIQAGNCIIITVKFS